MNGLTNYCNECGGVRDQDFRCDECGADNLCYFCLHPGRHECKAPSVDGRFEVTDTDRIDWLEENPEAVHRIADELLETDATVREAIDILMDEFGNENEY